VILGPARRRQVLWGLAGVHLFIALVYSSYLPVEHFIPPAIERPLRVYGSYSGTATHFDFFAPSVVSQVRVKFKLGSADGSERMYEVTTLSAEVNQRLAAMFNFYLRPTVQSFLVNSWSRYVLDKHPDAQWVQTRVEFLDIPTLAQAKEGRKASWVEIGRFGAVREAAPAR
jgi:hypothetical protein